MARLVKFEALKPINIEIHVVEALDDQSIDNFLQICNPKRMARWNNNRNSNAIIMSMAIQFIALAEKILIFSGSTVWVIQAVRCRKFKGGGQSGLGWHVAFP